MHLDLMRDAARTFPLIHNANEVTSLRVWHCKYASLEGLAQFSNLRELVIATYPHDSFDCLASLRCLQYLSIIHLPKVTDLSGLATLTKLERLSLQTLPSWDASRKRTRVNSLWPLSRLPLLRQLELLGICGPSQSVEDLKNVRSLETVRLMGYPRDFVAEYYAATEVKDEGIDPPKFTDQAENRG